MLVQQKVEEIVKRSPYLASALAAYTSAPGKVEIVSVDPSNSSRILAKLPAAAARMLLTGFENRDPLLLAFLEDIELLAVRLLPTASGVSERPVHGAQSRHALISTDLTFITNELGKTLKDRLAVLLANATQNFDCLVGYFFLSGFHRLYPHLENVQKVRILVGLQTDHITYGLIQKGPLFGRSARAGAAGAT